MDYKSDGLKWLNENFNYIDSVTVVDNTGKIIVKQRFNPRYSDEENLVHNESSLGKNLLEVFPSLTPDGSTLLQVLHTGKIVYIENQEAWNSHGRKTVCNNLNFPIISRGKIVGAVEISRDITHIENRIRPVQASLAPPPQPAGAARYHLDDIITQNPNMLRVKETIAKVASSASSVLVCGETGTGKELVVSSLHNAGYRRHKPFVAVNCAALPESILEGLLFGSRKGAFTGAENKKGLFEEADGGTIYLDEINSMPINLQAKLLRVLQEKQVMPLGSSKPLAVDVRIVASSNRLPDELLQSGEVRPDLLYRLNTVNLNIPPLRSRPEDIPLLISFFVEKYSHTFGRSVPPVSRDALLFLSNCSWNGNVRELEHAVEAAMNVMGEGEALTLEHLPAYLTMREPPIGGGEQAPTLSLAQSMELYEKKLITEALRACGGKIVDAAERLKVPRTTLQYKLDKYGIRRK
ncbi:arginine utilization regulatory protein RocR [Oscillospiraceae bacterium]|nr:arginine utilization regulatory protein RocR [Oscillospiraceae bacterium]BDF76299.1 arginine utilization regulatory protein RocR [Oscillospiraceae bacterium]